MKAKSMNFKLPINALKDAMRLAPVLWFLCAFVGALTFASTVMGETGKLTIEKIECEGNQKTSCDYIVSQTLLRETDVVEEEKVKDSKLRLLLLGLFDEADVRLAKGSEVGKAVVTISVQEHSSYTLSVSTGVVRPWTPFYGIVDATLADRNVTGHGDSLSLRVRGNYQNQTPADRWLSKRVDEELLSRIEYIRPALFLPRMYMVTGIGYGMKNWDRSEFTQQHNGWNDLALGYKLFDYASIAAGYRLFWLGNHSSPYIQYGWDSQDNPNFPTTGSRFQADLFFNSSSSSWYQYRNDYYYKYKLEFSFLKHWQLTEGHILSFRLGDIRANDPAFGMPENQALSLRYTNYFKRHATGSGIQNASFYVEPGVFATTGASQLQDQAGLKVGTTFQTPFAVFNVFAIASGFLTYK